MGRPLGEERKKSQAGGRGFCGSVGCWGAACVLGYVFGLLCGAVWLRWPRLSQDSLPAREGLSLSPVAGLGTAAAGAKGGDPASLWPVTAVRHCPFRCPRGQFCFPFSWQLVERGRHPAPALHTGPCHRGGLCCLLTPRNAPCSRPSPHSTCASFLPESMLFGALHFYFFFGFGSHPVLFSAQGAMWGPRDQILVCDGQAGTLATEMSLQPDC